MNIIYAIVGFMIVHPLLTLAISAMLYVIGLAFDVKEAGTEYWWSGR